MIAAKVHRGVVVPMVTPLTAEGTIDVDSVERLVDRLAAHGIGIFVLGTTGESALIPGEQRLRLVEAAVRHASGRVPVYAGISDNCLHQSVTYAERFLQSGVDAVVAHLPCYYELTAGEMFDYFAFLHQQVAGDLLVYNIPQTTRMSLPLEVVERISELPRVVGLKDSERCLARAREAADRMGNRSDFALFMGSAMLSVEALQMGFHGLVPSSGNFAPDLWRQLFDAALARDWTQASNLQGVLDELNLVFQRGRSLGHSIAALKVGLHLQEICQPFVAAPLQPIPEAGREQIRQQLAALRKAT